MDLKNSSGEAITLTGIKPGSVSENSQDAINGSQLYSTQKSIINQNNRINNMENRVDNLESQIDNIEGKLEKGMAKSAALNGLFQPYGVGKLNFTAAVGGYGSKNAVAVGTGYRFNENVAVKSAVSLTNGNGSDAMYNVGFSVEW
ncbi:YadA C-terminal domain-containing protein [Morganella morganii subsp. sibonii]